MLNVIRKGENIETEIENGERKNKNNRKNMTNLRKKVVPLQAGLQQKCIKGKIGTILRHKRKDQ